MPNPRQMEAVNPRDQTDANLGKHEKSQISVFGPRHSRKDVPPKETGPTPFRSAQRHIHATHSDAGPSTRCKDEAHQGRSGPRSSTTRPQVQEGPRSPRKEGQSTQRDPMSLMPPKAV